MRCLLALAIASLLVSSGCQGTLRFFSRVSDDLADSCRTRQQLREEVAEVRAQGREACRQECAAELRRELETIRHQQGPTAAELSANLNQKFKQKVMQTRMVVDRDAMSKRAEMLRRLEDEQERMYERALEDYLRRQAEFNRKEYEWSCMKSRQLAGDPSCRELPPRPSQFKELPPVRPQALNIGNEIIYKMELAVSTEIDGANLENAQARQVPLKERCAPSRGLQGGCCEKCGYNDCTCDQRTGILNDGSYQRRVEMLNPELPRVPQPSDDNAAPVEQPPHRRVNHVQIQDGEPNLIAPVPTGPMPNSPMPPSQIVPQTEPLSMPVPQPNPQANLPRPFSPLRAWRQ